jgi:SAM-dependent methyltransferase
MEGEHMGKFWDAKAREDAYYFIDNRRAYRDRDLAQFWIEGDRDLDRIFELLDVAVQPTDVVLDIGCGVGRLTRSLAGRGAEVYGLDVSGEMLELARRHHADVGNVKWIEGDGMTLAPIEDASIDVCVSHVVFQHIPDPQIVLGYVKEIGRVLRPGGWAAFQVSNDPSVHQPPTASGLVSSVASGLGRGPRGQGDPAWLGSAVDIADLRRVAGEGKLDLEAIFGEGTQFCFIRARRKADSGH